jgi:hypothetical protein
MSHCELFFCQNNLWGEAPFFYPLVEEWREMKLKKVTFRNSLSHFSLVSMHEAVGETVLRNIFSKTAQLHLESC